MFEYISSVFQDIIMNDVKDDFTKVKKKLDDLSFDYEDLKRDLIKRNRAKYYTNLSACAILRLNE